MGWSLALVLGASVLAAQAVPPRALRQAEGTVEEVNAESGMLRIRAPEAHFNLQITRATTVFVEGRTGSVEDLQVGAHVRGAYEGNATTGTLQWIEVGPE